METIKPTTLYLIRHGEVDNPTGIIYGSTVDVPLHPVGINQFRSLAQKFKAEGIRPEAIYTSPLTRAVRSAEILRDVLNPEISIIQDRRLGEMSTPGMEQFTQEWVEKIGDIYNYQGPEIEREILERLERPKSMAGRMIGAIGDMINSHPGQTVFVVSHGHPIAFTAWKLMNPSKETFPLAPDLIEKSAYLNKGEAWRFIIESDLRVIDQEIITRTSQFAN